MKAGYFFNISFIFLLAAFLCGCRPPVSQDPKAFADFVVDPQKSHIQFFLKDDESNYFRSIGNLKNYLSEKKGQKLRFAMNGGMYQKDNKPLGLFIQDRKTIAPLNVRTGEGNFYLPPNGVFYLTADRRAFLRQTKDFNTDTESPIEFATQSGPFLVIDGTVNPQFKVDSDNLNIRNGVCVLENGSVFFSISRREVNFYDFAEHFRQAGCSNALYLDGFVSRMYLPEQKIEQTDGNFGVIIGVID